MKRHAVVIGLVVLALATLVVMMPRKDRAGASSPKAKTLRRDSKETAIVRTSERTVSVPTTRPVHAKPIIDEEDDEDLTPEQKALKDRIEKALEDENLKAAVSCAEAARVCANKDIRQAMVDTLGWFGKGALPELTPFLADPDDDVRESACNEWSTAVSDIEDEREKISAVEMAMGILSDEDFLEDISNEYIGVDEKIAVESLMRIISDGKSKQGVDKAKETYEFVTGDEWQGADEARRWLVEEYEPPED